MPYPDVYTEGRCEIQQPEREHLGTEKPRFFFRGIPSTSDEVTDLKDFYFIKTQKTIVPGLITLIRSAFLNRKEHLVIL